MRIALLLGAAVATLFAADLAEARPRWTEAQAKAWYAEQPWLVGANYTPASAINQLEMWQAATWDPKRIDYELGLAQGIGMNTMRVFLHDQLWAQNPEGFRQRIDAFLTMAKAHGIRPLFVLFDSCWDPDPRLGPQHPPIPGVHNSGWVQGPGMAGLRDRAGCSRTIRAFWAGMCGTSPITAPTNIRGRRARSRWSARFWHRCSTGHALPIPRNR